MYVISLAFDIYSGLLFTCQALQNMQSDKSTELHVCFRRSYDVVLKHHHTFIIRSAVAVRGYIRIRASFYLIVGHLFILPGFYLSIVHATTTELSGGDEGHPPPTRFLQSFGPRWIA